MSGDSVLLALLALPFAGAFACLWAGRKSENGRNLAALAVTGAEFLGFLILFILFSAWRQDGFRQMHIFWGDAGMRMYLCLDGFRAVYCLIASFLWLMTALFSEEYFEHVRKKDRYYFFWLLTLGATVGVFLSANLFTTFLFFEIMSLASWVWVAQEETREALRAADTYLAVALIGGLVMLMGLFLLYDMFGTMNISELGRRIISLRAASAMPAGEAQASVSRARLYAAGGCLFFGFGAKAGVFLLHIWLPKAHPAAPAPASALLSGILTKTGIYGIIAVSASLFLYDGRWGAFVLAVGVLTMVTGAVLALFSVDLKRTLACSSVSQIGFILLGIGMTVLLGRDNGLAARGTLLHMVNHSLFKLVLFLAAGAVYMKLHLLDLNEIRGYGRKKPFLKAVFASGALGISGIPLFSGYISKTLLHEAILEYRAGGGITPLSGGALAFFTSGTWLGAAEWLFLFSGGCTLAYMLKLYAAIFVEKNADEKRQEQYDAMGETMRLGSRIALGVSAALIPAMGVLAHPVMDSLAALGEGFLGSSGLEEQVAYFSLENLQGALLTAGIGLALYFGLVRTFLMKKTESGRVYVNRWPAWLDLENLVYRPVLLTALPLFFGTLCRVLDRLPDGLIVLLRRTVYKDSPIPHELEEGNALTHAAGSFVDSVGAVFHRKTDYKHKFALLYEDFSENSTLIGRSLSFGLFMACLGLILMLVYLLV